MTEKTITICGKQVKMRYCAATEIGYEKLSDKSSAIFVPEVIKDENGTITDVKQNATLSDFVQLAIAGIIAAYDSENDDTPVTAKQILNEAAGNEVSKMVTTIVELRNDWYSVPNVAVTNDYVEEQEEKEKNV
jgi:hypothetical protein